MFFICAIVFHFYLLSRSVCNKGDCEIHKMENLEEVLFVFTNPCISKINIFVKDIYNIAIGKGINGRD